jgi:3-hydroxyisobutyrate dehydrogenase-like beta-hydroxyacid dehydrogenase
MCPRLPAAQSTRPSAGADRIEAEIDGGDAMTVTKVGVVGLGAMGRPIAQFIAQAGFDTVGYDRSADVTAQGVRAAASLGEMAACDAVIVIVPTDDDVREVVAGRHGLLAGGHPGLVVIVSASCLPQTCRELDAQAQPLGIRVIDAALTGGVRGAESGTLTLLVGGPQDVVDRVGDVFRAFSRGHHVLGDVGAGQIGKSAGNLIHWAQIVAIEESLRLARDLGVDPSRLRLALEDGPADSRALRELELMRFTWYIKDIEIARQMAAEIGMDLPVARLSRELMDTISVASVKALLRA